VQPPFPGHRSVEEGMDHDDGNSESRSYEKPTVESEEVFETLALTCTKSDAQCPPAAIGQVAQS
jgi:hypothetical protein